MTRLLITLLIVLSFIVDASAGRLKFSYQELGLLEHEEVKNGSQYEGKIRVGVSSPDYPPFDISVNGQYYDGISAKILGRISNAAGAELLIYMYNNSQDTLSALMRGEVDVINSYGQIYDVISPSVVKIPYITNNPMVSIIKKTSTPEIKSNKSIAIVDRYITNDMVRKIYPKAKVVVFDSVLNALLSVSLGANDLYIGDAISSEYYSENLAYHNLRVSEKLGGADIGGVFFTVRKDDGNTQKITTSGLRQISPSDIESLEKESGKSSDFITPGLPEYLSQQEKEWLKKNKVITVLLPASTPPFVIIKDNVFSGITPHLLKVMGKILGVEFHLTQLSSRHSSAESLQQGKVDMLGYVSSLYSVDPRYRFTRTYSQSSLVLVSNAATKPKKTLPDNIATPFDINELKPGFPASIRFIHTGSYDAAYKLLADNEVDAVIDTYASARYLSLEKTGAIHIDESLNHSIFKLSFGVAEQDDILYSILNKTLQNISFADMDSIYRHESTPSKNQLVPDENRTLAIVIILFIVFFSIILCVWVWSLKKNSKKMS